MFLTVIQNVWIRGYLKENEYFLSACNIDRESHDTTAYMYNKPRKFSQLFGW